MPHFPPVVPQASAAVSDKVLEQAIAAANHVAAGDIDRLDPDTATLFLMVAGPAMAECLQWRRRVGVIRDLACPENVILMPGAR